MKEKESTPSRRRSMRQRRPSVTMGQLQLVGIMIAAYSTAKMRL